MKGRVALGAFGIMVIGYGVVQVLVNLEQASPFGLVAFLVAVVVLDDLILVPLALGAGWWVGRTLPPAARIPTQVALVVMAGLGLVALPFALSPERGGESGTLLTEPYWRNLVLLGAVLAAAAAVAAGRRLRASPHDTEPVLPGDLP